MLRLSAVTALLLLCACTATRAQDRVLPIPPPASPLASETASAGVTKFSFIVYGDTRGRQDGKAIQAEHTQVMDKMLERIEQARSTDFPVRFVLQSGDAVVDGRDVAQWNVSFNPIISRLTAAGVPYYLVAGNHDVTTATKIGDGGRQTGLQNMLDAMAKMIPPDGSPRRLTGYPTYAIGYGNVFALGIDTNLIGDETQYAWVKAQLEGVDRKRYPHLFIFGHQNVFSSGPHGGAKTEDQTTELRTRYMPLFREHHVDAVFSGHEHFFERWVEHYSDTSGEHRLDLILSGGGGAPTYLFRSLPETQPYIDAHPENKIRLEQLVRPGTELAANPYHFLIFKVDGAKIEMETVGATAPYAPYQGSSKVTLK